MTGMSLNFKFILKFGISLLSWCIFLSHRKWADQLPYIFVNADMKITTIDILW